MSAAVRGRVSPGLEPVHDVFADLVDTGAETGAACCVLLGDDLWRRTLTAQVTGHDDLLCRETSWSLVGQVDDLGTGMGGIGGSAAYVGTGGRYAFAYVTRHLADHDRVDAVERALLRCLDR